MRFREILLEYRRDITARNYGAKLLDALLHDQLWNIYGTLAQALPDEMVPAIDAAHEMAVQQSKNFAYAQLMRDNAQTIIDYMLSRFEDADPTPNKRYTEWLARTYANSRQYDRRQFLFEDVVSTVAGYLRKFVDYSSRRLLQPPYNDINRYRTFSDFMNTIDRVSASAKTDKDSIKNRGRSTEYYVDDTVRVIVPHDEEASIYYGQGTRWCTAATTSANYFDRYNNEGPLYILIPKQPTHQGEKYQIHMAIRKDDSAELAEFMDERNEIVNPKILPERFSGFYKKFLSKYPGIKELTALADDSTLLSVFVETVSCAILQMYSLGNYYSAMARKREYSDERANFIGYIRTANKTVDKLEKMSTYNIDQLRKKIAEFETNEVVNLQMTLLNDFIAYDSAPNVTFGEEADTIVHAIREGIQIYKLSDTVTPDSIKNIYKKKSGLEILSSVVADGYYIVATKLRDY